MPTVGYKIPEYMSPSSLDCFESKPDEYYVRYLSPIKISKMAQTLPMSVGSSFDAYAKSWIHHALFGPGHKDAAKFELRTLFENQVEEACRDFAWGAGAYLFECYRHSGVLADLMIELGDSIDEPRFEFDIRGTIDGFREGITTNRIGVPILGKPDMKFVAASGMSVIYDWKVNGYCGKGNTSPTAGYIRILQQQRGGGGMGSGGGLSGPAGGGGSGSWLRLGEHRDAIIQKYKGVSINMATYFEQHDAKWATQLASYGWLLGEQVGSECVVGIHQVACNGQDRDELGRPLIRFAVHSSRISADFQFKVLARYQNAWSIINESPLWLFRDLSREENDRKIEALDRLVSLDSAGTETDEAWVARMGRSGY